MKTVVAYSNFKSPLFYNVPSFPDGELGINTNSLRIHEERQKIIPMMISFAKNKENFQFVFSELDETYYMIEYNYDDLNKTRYVPIKEFFIKEEDDPHFSRDYTYYATLPVSYMQLGYFDENLDVSLIPITAFQVYAYNDPKALGAFIDRDDDVHKIYRFNRIEEIL